MGYSLLRLRQLFSDYRQGAVIVALYLLVGLSSFIIGFTGFFPDTILQQRVQHEINRNFPGNISIEQIRYSFPAAIKAENVLINFADRSMPKLDFDTINFTPHLASLIGQPGINFTATAQDGTIKGSFSRTGAFSVAISDYRFDEPVQGFAELRLGGTINSAQISSHLSPAPENASRVNLEVTGISLFGLGSAGLEADRLDIGNLDIEMNGKGNNLAISKGVLAGGDILAEATGRIETGRTIRSTRLNLNLLIKPSADLDPSLASLMELVGTPTSDGSRKLNIGGTLARPNFK